MSMLRALDAPRRARRRRPPALRAHARRRHLRRRSCASSARRHPGFRLHEQLTGDARPDGPAATSTSCAPTGASARPSSAGPADMLDALTEHWDGAGRRPTACTWSASSPSSARATPSTARAGRSASARATSRPSSDGSTPILVAGEEAGATLPFGCRMGICHTCVGKLCSGQIRDLRTGKVSGSARRDRPHLRQRPRRPRRDRTCDPTTTEDQHGHDDRKPARAPDATSRSTSSAASSTRSTTRSSPTSAIATGATSRA